MGSWCGLITTIGFWTIFLCLVSVSVLRLLSGSNPLISSVVDLDFYGPEEKVDIYESNMLGAFQVLDFNTKQPATDPNFFSWKAQMIESDGETDISFLKLELDICSDDDILSFYPPSKTSAMKFEKLTKAEGRTLMCIKPTNDEGQPMDLKIWGKSELEPHRRLDLSFMPCTP